mmetsp:Transcript_22057/g.50395  ORF Transcript_22057/g.50395 Transcript_22057/m.50395 type:complete len:85 (-) Transcript_22057:459-713(-)
MVQRCPTVFVLKINQLRSILRPAQSAHDVAIATIRQQVDAALSPAIEVQDVGSCIKQCTQDVLRGSEKERRLPEPVDEIDICLV